MGLIKSFDDCDENGSQPASDLVIGGLGSRKQVHLVATRWFLGEENACIESRVIHKFSIMVSGCDAVVINIAWLVGSAVHGGF